jgi:molecular chaperone IbpA
MLNVDFSPFMRSSVGFDRMFDALENALSVPEDTGWPPYNIRKTGDASYRIELAVPGFKPEEVSITAQQNVLTVTGKRPEGEKNEYLYRGIAAGSFERRFSLADFVKVTGANLEHGVLRIDLVREIPEEMRPRKIAINAGPQPPTIEHKAA